jgi:hypothetical protein
MTEFSKGNNVREEEPQVGAPQESRESDMYKGTYAGK